MSRAHPYIPHGVNQQGHIQPVAYTPEQQQLAAAISDLTLHLLGGLVALASGFGLAWVLGAGGAPL